MVHHSSLLLVNLVLGGILWYTKPFQTDSECMIQQCSSVKHGEKSPMLDEISAKFVGEIAILHHSSPWFSCFFFPRTNILVFFTKKIRDARDGFLGFFQVQPIVFSRFLNHAFSLLAFVTSGKASHGGRAAWRETSILNFYKSSG